MDKLGGFALELGSISLEQSFKTLPRFRPLFPQKRNFREVETGVPEFRIGRERFLKRCLRLVVFGLAHQDDAAQILRLRQVRLACIDRIEFFQRLRVIGGIEFAEGLVVHRLELRLGRGNIRRRERTNNQDRNRREFPNVHAKRHTSYRRAERQANFAVLPAKIHFSRKTLPGCELRPVYRGLFGSVFRFATIRKPSSVRFGWTASISGNLRAINCA